MKNALIIANFILDFLIVGLFLSLLAGCSSVQHYRTEATFTIEVKDQDGHKGWSKTWKKEQSDE
jgi:hypothetical protein